MRVMFVVNDLGINEPFGPMILSAVLKKKGHVTTLGVLQKEDVKRKIERFKPDLLAYSMMSVDMQDMKRFNLSLRKKKNIFTLLGGPHATLEQRCIEDAGVDAICVGEGEDAIVDVVDCLGAGRGLEGIPNILTSKESPLVLRKLIDDFDAYPFMDRELVYSYPEMRRFGIKGIWASRGCAFRCPFCFNNRYNEIFRHEGKVVRRRSVDSIVREMIELKENYRVAFVRIQDDVFLYRSDEWLKSFAQRWPVEVGLPFYCLLRAELVTDEMAGYLKRAGCFSVCMSIEAADDEVRVKMMRRNVSKAQLEEAFRIFKRHKINVYANSILALPFTSIEYDIASLDFAIKVRPQMPNLSIFMPYPGTELGDYCKRAGIYDPEHDDIAYGMRNMSPLTCFSKKVKEAQYNLCQLAIVAVKFPKLRNFIVNQLIYWKPNKLFFAVHYLCAVSSYGRKIFYFKHSIGEYIDLFARTIRHYLYDFTAGKKRPQVKKLMSEAKEPKEKDRLAGLAACLNAMACKQLNLE